LFVNIAQIYSWIENKINTVVKMQEKRKSKIKEKNTENTLKMH